MKKNDNLNTPDYIFNQLNQIYQFQVDAACESNNKKCNKGFCFDEGKDGLTESWKGKRVFCNPPFSKKNDWIMKAVEEVEDNSCPVCIMVLPLNCMSASAFQKYVKGKYHYDVPEKRISFLDNDTKVPQTNNNTGTIIIHFMKGIII